MTTIIRFVRGSKTLEESLRKNPVTPCVGPNHCCLSCILPSIHITALFQLCRHPSSSFYLLSDRMQQVPVQYSGAYKAQ